MKKRQIYGIGIFLGVLLIGCGSGNSSEEITSDTNSNSSSASTFTLPNSYMADEGRLLASGCFQCHGTNGVSVNDWDSIAGEDELHEEMFEDDEPIMTAQAKGYTTNEITLIEDYIKNLKDVKKESDSDENDKENEKDD